GGKYESVTNKATGAEKDQVLKDINLMWDALSNSTLSSNAELRQFAMSISGSVIFGSNGEMRILSSLASDRSLLSAMMSGGSAKVYVCDNQNKCLSPSLNNVTISESKSLIRMVRDTLTSIENKAITDTPLTEREKQFINSTSIPILSWIVDQSSLSVSQSLFAQLTDYIAVDIYLQYLEAVMKVVNGSLATKDYPGANMNELKNGLADARQALNSLRMEVQIKENALISAQQQIRFIRQQVSSKMSDRVLGNYQFSRVN
ncbi:conjugal transfer protein, partial [Escherichia coli]|nr:conjugal transfer protein [Escherichia coli]